VMTNPVAPDHLRSVDRLDIMVITHGHGDHVSDAVQIAKATNPTVVTTVEVGGWLGREGVTDKVIAFNKGGTVEVDGISFTMVHAEHTSSTPDGAYGGEPVGFVIEFENGFKVYFSGDTDVFGDMALIGELYSPDVALLPIGDFYTMGPYEAAKAVELLGVKQVIPTHFGTFPALVGNPDGLRAELGKRGLGDVTVLDTEPGGTIE
jgi:L-ascorbate metabolism protein UlaG (beta-lactamase superfamily)